MRALYGSPPPLGARLAAFAVLVLAVAGCGDDSNNVPADANPNTDGAMNPDAPPANDFTAFVKGQILNNTSDTADPVPYAVFATLPDLDLDNPAAYADLFQ